MSLYPFHSDRNSFFISPPRQGMVDRDATRASGLSTCSQGPQPLLWFTIQLATITLVNNTVGHHPVNLSLNLSLLLPRHNDQMLSPLLPGQLAQALILRASPAQYSASSSPLTEGRWPAPSVHSSRCRRDAGKPESHLATTTAVFHSTHFVGRTQNHIWRTHVI